MKPGDHVKVMGQDGFYVFVEEVQGMATLRVANTHSREVPNLSIPISQVVSLEKEKTLLGGAVRPGRH